MKDCVIFISHYIPLSSSNSTSTDIMTANLVKGLSQNALDLAFVAIVDGDLHAQEIAIQKDFNGVPLKLVVLPSCIPTKVSPLKKLLYTYKAASKRPYKKFASTLKTLGPASKLIAHCPALDSAICCKQIKRLNPNAKIVEYWSDPYALSNTSIDAYSSKRFLMKLMEAKVLSWADKIVYGTKPLMEQQKQFYPKYSRKMDYIDVAYTEYADEGPMSPFPRNRILYAGGYVTSIRNIRPLLDAVSKTPEVELDVYGSGDVKIESENIHCHAWISPKDFKLIERQYQIVVALMNKKTVQIPGKTFYGMNRQQNIMVILDGPASNEIENYLKGMNRFNICKNESEDIQKAIHECIDKPVPLNCIDEFSPRTISGNLLKAFDE